MDIRSFSHMRTSRPESHEPAGTRATLLLRLNASGSAREVAWEEFYKIYSPIIVGFARRIGASPEEGDELVQEVMRAFFRSSPEFEYDPSRGRFRGYLRTCVCRKLASLRRKSAGAPGKVDALGDRADQLADDRAGADAWEDVWETEKLHRALAMVRERYSGDPTRERTFRAFEMATLLERPTEEVAAELGLSDESVRAAKSRVSRALKQAFDHLDAETG